MQETWNKFVYELCEAKKKNMDENEYHSLIEIQLQLLGWAKYNGEICHKPNIPIGNNQSIQPDILIKKDGEEQFVVEVKRPVHIQKDRERQQLVSYMRQLKLKIGIYIGEHIEVFYDHPNNKDAVSVLKVALELDNTKGVRFVELFSKKQFNDSDIVTFCEERIKEMQRQENLNKIKENLVSEDGQILIKESLMQYLTEKYRGDFAENEIDKMLSTLRFNAMPKEVIAQEKSHSTNGCKRNDKSKIRKQTTSQITSIPCFLSRKGIDVKGVFNPDDKSLTVLKGSKISSTNNPSFRPADITRRDTLMAEYTEMRDGDVYVKQDVCFKTPSGAAIFCIGGSSNGWIDWKDGNNNSLDKYRN